jgi:hypothetical protein
MLKSLFILILAIGSQVAFAQKVEVIADTVATSGDSIRVMKNGKIITIESYAKRYQPRKALLYAAVLPGLGQAYNRKYWKLPLVYGGFGLIAVVAVTYDIGYENSKTELFTMLRTGSTTSSKGYNEEQVRSLIDNYRRQRDYFIIIGVFWYILQMVDAHVDAHLKEFDLNPQLKLAVKPSIQNTLVGQASGLSLTLTF